MKTPDTVWSLLRWCLALSTARLALWLAPDGTAKRRWVTYNGVWAKECRAAWKLRYPDEKPIDSATAPR